MNYYSTNRKAPKVSLREAVLNGLAPDGGLYMPEHIPVLPREFFERLTSLSFPEIAVEVGSTLFDGDLSEEFLKSICTESFNFPVPLVSLDEHTYVLELFHGPTLAFKDFAAAFMARLMGYYVRNDDHELTILVATSGDTGSAVAHGFFNVPGIRVFILYPSGRVSDLQEKQLTTMGGNITALEIQGSFDDCQALAKTAFQDRDLQTKMRMGSANSINIARLFPQTFYYFWAIARHSEAQSRNPVFSESAGIPRQARDDNGIVISIPCGNVGNLTAGLIAKRMGLPVSHFVAACNANNVLPAYLDTGAFTPQASRATISNAMDVGNPSNFARMLELYNHTVDAMRQDLSAYSFTDEQTRDAIRSVNKRTSYVMDPHGAVGYLGLKKYRAEIGDKSEFSEQKFGLDTNFYIFIETAHPAKFGDSVQDAIGAPVDIPVRLAEYMKREKHAVVLSSRFEELKDYLMNS